MQKLCIQKIHIKDSLTFKEATFYPNAHFNVFSGASGAGKSVLMESILALFGLKDCNATLIEATFELQGIPQGFEGLIDEGEVILTLSKKDKIRYFLNAQNIPKKKIQELFTPFLKHLSNKSYDAISEQNLFFALDNFLISKNPKHKEVLQNYKESFLRFTETKNTLKTLQEETLKVAELKEFVRFEIQKLETLDPKQGEYEELLELKKEISKKEKINESLQSVREILNQSHKISQFLNLIQSKENDSILNALNSLENLCEQESERLEALEMCNPEEILNRIEALSALKHRYGGVDEALEYLENKKQELQKYENLDSILKNAETSYNQAKNALKESAESLTNARKKHLKDFENTLNSALASLKMPNSKVALKSLLEVESYNILGAQSLEITLNTSLKNLSSGEFNRFRLALLLTYSTQTNHQAVIILDEVDANLSGEESQGVASVLKTLSTSYQVFAISHQPHMPSLADAHFLIQKHPNGSTITELNKQGRIQEIARMISGDSITKEALEFATKQLSTL
ncbi:DNA repair protein [Helicobacter turcicus]|uniref:DNA repair protein RecN n=1 Tax=Helicobacter turcicus TaxID=2867412 RepID=A0ABS7JN34_9HELI|nr:DNA repair protein [Helicobacter turcicus]MBX7490824.1 DNA repair protein [Helicobacter turcicus]MBX7545567.1 DNA repair protein [Helicobacter turcicus]